MNHVRQTQRDPPIASGPMQDLTNQHKQTLLKSIMEEKSCSDLNVSCLMSISENSQLHRIFPAWSRDQFGNSEPISSKQLGWTHRNWLGWLSSECKQINQIYPVIEVCLVNHSICALINYGIFDQSFEVATDLIC